MKIFLNTLLVLFLFISTTIYGQLSNAEKIDAIMERYASSETPGASVLIMQGGKIIFKKG